MHSWVSHDIDDDRGFGGECVFQGWSDFIRTLHADSLAAHGLSDQGKIHVSEEHQVRRFAASRPIRLLDER